MFQQKFELLCKINRGSKVTYSNGSVRSDGTNTMLCKYIYLSFH